MKLSQRCVWRTRRQRRLFLGESERFSGLRAGSADSSSTFNFLLLLLLLRPNLSAAIPSFHSVSLDGGVESAA